jgi:hypothetical protein
MIWISELFSLIKKLATKYFKKEILSPALLIQSHGGGNNFAAAEKLGTGDWPLNGCSMDGGGVAVKTNNLVQTVWCRQDKIFSCKPGKSETEIGKGRSCSIESVNDKNVYAWTENGNVVCLLQQGKKINLGKGMVPIVKAINDEHIICVWENENQIHTAVLVL